MAQFKRLMRQVFGSRNVRFITRYIPCLASVPLTRKVPLGTVRAGASCLMSILKANLQLIQAVLPAIMVDDTLKRRYYEGVIAPTYDLAERYFQTLQENGTLRPLETDLLVRALPSLLLGLPILSILGDETVGNAWERLPDLLSELILHGILPKER